ncbi:HNH endonuclease [Alkalinema pantanalense CENA528]|uniref:HNH endonuclease n=1 Tax=Alkalinema pantanalense TaxID=1620705 RepID=UPI003D6FA675
MARAKIPQQIKQQVSERAGGCCEYCRSQRKFSPSSFEIEHIIPISRGGDDSLENLALACGQCNNHKSNKVSAIDPASGQIVPLFHPRTMAWDEHFLWSDDTLEILPITAIGRATVTLLQTNRESVVNLRRLLRFREHPPA